MHHKKRFTGYAFVKCVFFASLLVCIIVFIIGVNSDSQLVLFCEDCGGIGSCVWVSVCVRVCVCVCVCWFGCVCVCD